MLIIVALPNNNYVQSNAGIVFACCRFFDGGREEASDMIDAGLVGVVRIMLRATILRW